MTPLSGCSVSPPSTTEKPQLTYEHLAPLPLDVMDVQIVDSYKPSFSAPYVDHLFPNQPRNAIKAMLQKRLKPVGKTNTLRITLENASVIEEPVDGISTGVSAFLSREVDRRYRALVRMNIEFLSPDGIRLGGAPLRAERTHEALEGLSITAREKLWLEMTEKLVNDIDQAIIDIMQNQLSRFLSAE